MTPRLDNRPLLGEIDAGLFVAPSIMPRLRVAVERRLNVLILGAPGSGKTSLLRALMADPPSTDGRGIVYVDLGPATNALQALALIGEGLGQRDTIGDTLRVGLDPRTTSSAELLRLTRRLGEVPPSVIMLDTPPGEGASHTLFGQLRDELWQLEHQWVVAARSTLRDELTRPPANAFFDVHLELEGFSLEGQTELLQRRLADDPSIDVAALVGQTDGLPRALVQLAREAVLSEYGVEEIIARHEQRRAQLSELPQSAQTVIGYLRSNGPASGSDAQLLGELGVSGQRARQILRGLEEAGFVRSFTEQEERRGRPRKLYEVVEGPGRA